MRSYLAPVSSYDVPSRLAPDISGTSSANEVRPMLQQQSEQVPPKISTSGSPEFFHYKRSKIMAIDTALTLVAGGAWASASLVEGGATVGGVVLGLCTYAFILPMYLAARFQASTICVDEKAITATLLGFRWRTIEWRNVKGVRVYTMPSMYGSGPLVSFFIDQDSRVHPSFTHLFRKRGPVSFWGSIINNRTLLDLINAFAIQYGIPIRCYFTESGEFIKEPRLVEKL